MRFYTTAALAALVACTSACDSTSAPATNASLPDAAGPGGYAAKYADAGPTYDAQLNEVSLEYPGFKGVIGSEDGSGIIVLTDQTTAQARGTASTNDGLADALSSRLGVAPSELTFAAPSAAQARPSSGQAAPVADRPDFHVLYEVKTGLRRFMFETDLVNALDLDEKTGRVVVGASSSAAIDQLRSAMTAAELSNVDFEVTGRATNLVLHVDDSPLTALAGASGSMVNRSLRNSVFTPLVGGTEIDFSNSAGQLIRCTQGPVVRNSSTGAFGFLTNSHCTFDRTRISNISYYQPTITPTYLIGNETSEPAYRSGAFISDGFYADVAFIRTQSGVGLSGQMTSADNCSRTGTDCVENGIINDVSGSVEYLAVNAQVLKTGRSTGTTAGYISRTCYDLVEEDGLQNLCQNEVRYSSSIPSPTRIADNGDSGSPVLSSGGVPGAARPIAGILWGGDGSPGLFFYSPWENIGTTARAGTAYGLPVQVVSTSQGTVSNSTSTGGGGTGGGGCIPPGGGGDGSTGYGLPVCP